MCRRKNKQEPIQEPVMAQEEVNPVAQPAPVVPRQTDYFSEYYKAYKNDYIQQYLDAYHKYKETGEMDDTMRELYGFSVDTDHEEGDNQ